MVGELTIREAVPQDAHSIAELHASSWLRTYAGSMRQEYLEAEAPGERERLWEDRFRAPDPDQVVLLAELHGRIVGFVCAYLDGRDGRGAWGSFIDNLHVSQPHQGQGIGRALMRAMAEWTSRSRPGCGMYLSVTEANAAAQEFYRRIGGEVAGRGVWAAPDGSAVPMLWIIWQDLEVLSRS